MPDNSDNYFFQKNFEDKERFYSLLSSYVRKFDIRLNALLISSPDDFLKTISDWQPDNFSFAAINSGEVITIEIKKLSNEKASIALASIIRYNDEENIFLIISDCKTSDFKNIVTAFVNKYYPKVFRIFLTNNELYLILKNIEGKNNQKVEIESSVIKRRINSSKKIESQVLYTKVPLDPYYDSIRINDQWIDSIRYKVTKKTIGDEEYEYNLYTGNITRSGYFSIKSDVIPLMKSIIPDAIKYANVRYNYFKVRSDKANLDQPEPIVISFSDAIFDKIPNQKLIEVMSNLDSASISIFHKNPYLHLSLLDYKDGSSYDLWIVSNDQLIIIPQFKASISSMNRLVEYIFGKIQEGEIEQYEQLANNG